MTFFLIITLKTIKFRSSVLFEHTNSTRQITKNITNSIKFISIRVSLAQHGPLFKGMHFVANDPPKRNAIKVCLINLNIILYHVFSLNICGYPQYQYHQ